MARPTTDYVIPIAREYLRMPDHGAGGSLHVVLSDLNVRDGDLTFCYLFAMRDSELYKDHPYGLPDAMGEPPDVLGAALALLLLAMTKTQRLRVAHRCWEDA